MSFLSLSEGPSTLSSPRSRLSLYFFVAFLIAVAAKAAKFSGANVEVGQRELVDFDDFYIVGQLVWQGGIAKAYHFATMSQIQQTISGQQSYMPWTYPPQFDLMVAPLALLPLGAAYAVFISVTLLSYLAVLRRFAGEMFLPVIIVLLPPIFITIACGQNGFLTGTLIGLTCLGLQKERTWSGVPLGLMAIKPHLAVAFAVYFVINRRWGAVLVAAATLAFSTLFSTILLGHAIWTHFFEGIHEAQIFLEKGFYPFFRMVSVYACVRTLGAPAPFAFALQLIVAATAIFAVWIASLRLPARAAIGVTAIASLLISPYAYDYDLPILGIGLALLAPDIERFATERERLALLGMCLIAGGWGMVNYTIELVKTWVFGMREADLGQELALSLGGLATIAVFVMCWRIVGRDRGQMKSLISLSERSARAT